jgi:hypothetical protein
MYYNLAMKIRRSDAATAHIADGISDAQLLAAITDPEWSEIERQGDYVRVVGLAAGQHLPRDFPLLEVGYFYLDATDEALVVWAVPAGKEGFEQWANQT